MKRLPTKIKIQTEVNYPRDWPIILVDSDSSEEDIPAVAWVWDEDIAQEIVRRWNETNEW